MEMTGGCMCGAKRFAVQIDSDDAYLCHCRMCQRWMGNVSVAMVGVRKDAVRWETRPEYYRSSPIAERGFCATCGTSLTFEFMDGETMDLTVGSFDDPSRFKPRHHYAAESLHEGWLDTRELERIRSEDNLNVVKRWMDACGKLPD
jgi:hypothetical protein